MMVLCQPHREDIELVIAGEHRVERGEVAKRLLHHLGARIHEDAMHSGSDAREAAPDCAPRPGASEAKTHPGPSCRANG